jgi:hypothetical protein
MAAPHDDNPHEFSGLLLARVHKARRAKSSLPTKIVIGCLAFGCVACAWMALIVLGFMIHGYFDPTGAAIIVLFLVSVEILCGLHCRRTWAWFATMLLFATYILVGGSAFYFGINPLLALLPIGAVGLGCLFARNCRKEFGLGRS